MARGLDKNLPKIKLLNRQVNLDTIEGSNFPSMFSYRSVLFSNKQDTTFGLVVTCDDLALGQGYSLKSENITKSYALNHPMEMNLLLRLIVQAANDQNIDPEKLQFLSAFKPSDSIDFLSKMGYEVVASFTAEPQLSVAARLNGMPLFSLHDDDNIYELMQGGIKGSHYGMENVLAIYLAMMKDMNSEEGEIADLVYSPVSREKSVLMDKASTEMGIPFGTIDIHVLRTFNVTGAEIIFRGMDNVYFHDENLSRVFDAYDINVSATERRDRSHYTAGKAKLGNVRTARIRTEEAYFGGVLVHDILCLVHEESGSNLVYDAIP